MNVDVYLTGIKVAGVNRATDEHPASVNYEVSFDVTFEWSTNRTQMSVFVRTSEGFTAASIEACKLLQNLGVRLKEEAEKLEAEQHQGTLPS